MIDKLSIDLSEYRFKKAEDLLSQAKLLHSYKKYDGSINRSYYAIFNGMKSLLALAKLDSSKHSGIISLFDKYFVKSELMKKKYSEIAHSAFDNRQDNDYEDFYVPSKEESDSQINGCEDFLTGVDKIRKIIISGEKEIPSIN